MVLSNITLLGIDVGSSFLKPGDTGIVIVASEMTCNLTMNWRYSYSTWFLPVSFSDEGTASIRVEGMEVGLTLGLEVQEGKLKLSLAQCGCLVKDISIKLDGGASWLYQGMIDAFEEQIESTVENAIMQKLKEGILKLDVFLQSLPEEIPLDDTASLNVTFANEPLLCNSSVGFEINGLFSPRKIVPVLKYQENDSESPVSCMDSESLVSCMDVSKMLGISLHEFVFNSASALYYDAEFMQWVVDKIPDQSLLNTAGWRFIIPQLYKKYPNDDMNLNISLSSAPAIVVSEHGFDATVYADLIIDVVEEGRIVPVACISLVIRGSGLAKLLGNNLAGSVELDDFVMSLKWSNIGNLHLFLIQPVMWTLLQTVFLPYTNAILGKGFPLPIIHGFTLENAELVYSNSRVTVCGDVQYTK